MINVILSNRKVVKNMITLFCAMMCIALAIIYEIVRGIAILFGVDMPHFWEGRNYRPMREQE